MFLGLDLGTSGLKALLIDEEQNAVAEATAPLSVSRPHPGWSEQDPQDWIDAAEGALRALSGKANLSAVRGIGLSGQMHGATLYDDAHRPLRPSILWNDTRAGAEAANLDGMPLFRQTTGNIVFPGFTAPKLLWVRAHERSVFDKTKLVLLPKDALRLWLTGDAITEPSDASGTAWLDVGAREFSEPLLDACHLTISHMPRIVESDEASGGLRADVAGRFGLPAGVPVAGGAGDNAAAAIGMGIVKPGAAFVSLGTSGVLFAAAPQYAPMPDTAVHTFCHAMPGAWHQMGVILAATDALNWLAGLTGTSAEDLTGGLGDLQAPGRPIFLPYLGGERTPHNDAHVRGAFLGLSHDTDAAAATRAVLEGVTFALRDCRDALSATGTGLDSLIAVGGGARSQYWLKAIATALGIPVKVPASGDYGAAFGAARLGMMAAGADVSVLSAPQIAHTIQPDNTLTTSFAEGHARYKAAYTATKEF
ncbi:MAG: xylulokinase [Pseudomonadota bacterium]